MGHITGNKTLRYGIMIWVVWTILAVIYTTKIFVYKLIKGPGASWTGAAYLQFSSAWLWAILTPAIYWITRKIPIHRSNLKVSLPIHFVISLLIGPIQSFVTIWLDMSFRKLTGNLTDENVLDVVFSLSRITVSESFDSLAIYWIIVIVIYSLEHYQKLRSNQLKLITTQKQLADAKYESLKMQLHPHFLFNTLNTISSLIYSNPDKADKMISELSSLMRISLDSINRTRISLREEISFIKKYLEIQSYRYEERLITKFDIENTATTFKVPTFILQPIVENSIRHAVEPNINPVVVEISASIVNDSLRLVVIDNGPGFDMTCKKGVGIANTKERLKQLYDNDCRFEIVNNHGTQVILILPPKLNGIEKIH